MAFSTNLRRFHITTGSLPTTNVRGVVTPEGECLYQEYIGASDKSCDVIKGKLSDLTERFSGMAGYALTYTDPAAPTFTSVSPTSGTTAGGTAITITGTNLNSASVAVTVGGAAATTIRSNATTITCSTPAGTSGAKPIVITTNEGTVTAASAFTYS